MYHVRPPGWRPGKVDQRARKDTYFLTSIRSRHSLARLCDKRHVHIAAIGAVRVENKRIARAKAAGAYPPSSARAGLIWVQNISELGSIAHELARISCLSPPPPPPPPLFRQCCGLQEFIATTTRFSSISVFCSRSIKGCEFGVLIAVVLGLTCLATALLKIQSCWSTTLNVFGSVTDFS